MENLVEAIDSLKIHDCYDWMILICSIVIPILTAIINVYIVNRNTNKQIANQNKETYRPRLRLKNVQSTYNRDMEQILYAHSKNYSEEEHEISQYFEINLENIGNGLANDISFYMLNSGEKCYGYQNKDHNNNQVLDSTIEIPMNESGKIVFSMNFNKQFINPEKEYPNNEDFVLLICNYKDLNNNNYQILIGIIIKQYNENDNYEEMHINQYSLTYDYYYYQENTDKFNGMIKKDIYKDNYKKIQSQIKSNVKQKTFN